ncbi:hypothetical protein [Cytobacillus gottheilii]|uniref:hypothetical protein n=1 Tax=Cytobacillus gottheilii TaxID=859144 RepID=UPI00083580A6|nr:hypothetical protein [Cytobacillus gottheilii]
MDIQMQKANMLADQVRDFILLVQEKHKQDEGIFHIKLLIEDFKLRVLSDELKRINRYEWDGKYSYYLVKRLKKGFQVIEEYIQGREELYLIHGRLYTINKGLMLLNNGENGEPSE